MDKTKRLIISLMAGLQIPIAYYLSGHDLWVREKGLGLIYLCALAVTFFFYLFLRVDDLKGQK
jgi:hypothetical protein